MISYKNSMRITGTKSLQVLSIFGKPKYFTSYRARVPKLGGKTAVTAKTVKIAKNCKKGGKNSFQSNGSYGLSSGLGVSTISL